MQVSYVCRLVTLSFACFQAIPGAPRSSQKLLQTLAMLYGVCCVSENAGFYYSLGVLPMGSDEVLRQQQLELQTALMGNNGRDLLTLCAGFGIPEHCIHAQIAFDWRLL